MAKTVSRPELANDCIRAGSVTFGLLIGLFVPLAHAQAPVIVLCNAAQRASILQLAPFGVESPSDASCLSSTSVPPCVPGYTLPPADPTNTTLWQGVPAPPGVPGVAATAVVALPDSLPLLGPSSYASFMSPLPCPAGLYCPANARCAMICGDGFTCLPLAPTPGGPCTSSPYPGSVWPMACPKGYFCPFASAPAQPCPGTSFCPEGSLAPRDCPLLSICSSGNERQRWLGLLLAAGSILCLLLMFGVFVAIRQYRRWSREQLRRHNGESATNRNSAQFNAPPLDSGGFAIRSAGHQMGVKICGLTVHAPAFFSKPQVLLDAISCELKRGKVTAVMGSSGAG